MWLSWFLLLPPHWSQTKNTSIIRFPSLPLVNWSSPRRFRRGTFFFPACVCSVANVYVLCERKFFVYVLVCVFCFVFRLDSRRASRLQYVLGFMSWKELNEMHNRQLIDNKLNEEWLVNVFIIHGERADRNWLSLNDCILSSHTSSPWPMIGGKTTQLVLPGVCETSLLEWDERQRLFRGKDNDLPLRFSRKIEKAHTKVRNPDRRDETKCTITRNNKNTLSTQWNERTRGDKNESERERQRQSVKEKKMLCTSLKHELMAIVSTREVNIYFHWFLYVYTNSSLWSYPVHVDYRSDNRGSCRRFYSTGIDRRIVSRSVRFYYSG